MFMKKSNYQDKKNNFNKDDINYICTCQFFFDHINEIEQLIIEEKHHSIKNNESKPIFVSSNLKLKDDGLTAITITLPKHCFDGFYDQTVKSLVKRFAKIKYIKAKQFILVPLTHFKKYINNKGEFTAVDDNSAFDFFEIKFNTQQEVIIMQQVQEGKLVQYKKIDPNNLTLHLSKEINEANLIKNNKSLTNLNILQR